MNCPTCQRELDAIRAPIARIVGGKVTTFCSVECSRGEPRPSLMTPAVPAPVTLNAPAGTDGIVVAEVRSSAGASSATPTAIVGRAERSGPVLAPAPPPSPRSKKRVVFAAVGMLVAAGIGGAIVQSVSPGRSSPVAASEPDGAQAAAAPAPAPLPVPVVPTKADVLASATSLLEGFLADASPRMRREAAMALARVKHPGALEELVKQLDAEPSVIAQVAVAEALARAGHARGRDFLHAAVGHERRDVRMSAAIALASMGDPKGRGPLMSALSSRILRLSAAGSLALLGQPEGVKALEEALGASEPEPRMRAAAALGKAGNPAGAAVLREMVADPRYEQLAATALARLGDTSVVPVLTRALGLTALAVEAAEALRRLGADVEPALVAAQLAAGDEIARIEAAEAALVLFGDVVLEPIPPAAAAPGPAVAEPTPAPAPARAKGGADADRGGRDAAAGARRGAAAPSAAPNAPAATAPDDETPAAPAAPAAPDGETPAAPPAKEVP